MHSRVSAPVGVKHNVHVEFDAVENKLTVRVEQAPLVDRLE